MYFFRNPSFIIYIGKKFKKILKKVLTKFVKSDRMVLSKWMAKENIVYQYVYSFVYSFIYSFSRQFEKMKKIKKSVDKKY